MKYGGGGGVITVDVGFIAYIKVIEYSLKLLYYLPFIENLSSLKYLRKIAPIFDLFITAS